MIVDIPGVGHVGFPGGTARRTGVRKGSSGLNFKGVIPKTAAEGVILLLLEVVVADFGVVEVLGDVVGVVLVVDDTAAEELVDRYAVVVVIAYTEVPSEM